MFAGSGPLEHMLEAVPNIRYVGFQTGDALEKLIREAKFTVYPSEWYENCPFSVIESILYGTPVLGADIGGIPELIRPGENGELFQSGNKEELIRYISEMWQTEALEERYSLGYMDETFLPIGKYIEELSRICKILPHAGE